MDKELDFTGKTILVTGSGRNSSPRAGAITGSAIHIDGGARMLG